MNYKLPAPRVSKCPTFVFRDFSQTLWLVSGDFAPGTNPPKSGVILPEFPQGYY